MFSVDDDLDGKPLDEDRHHHNQQQHGGGGRRTEGAFVPSRWEEVDPELIEEQAMTTSKWELLEENRLQNQHLNSGDDSREPLQNQREPSPASNDSRFVVH